MNTLSHNRVPRLATLDAKDTWNRWWLYLPVRIKNETCILKLTCSCKIDQRHIFGDVLNNFFVPSWYVRSSTSTTRYDLRTNKKQLHKNICCSFIRFWTACWCLTDTPVGIAESFSDGEELSCSTSENVRKHSLCSSPWPVILKNENWEIEKYDMTVMWGKYETNIIKMKRWVSSKIKFHVIL